MQRLQDRALRIVYFKDRILQSHELHKKAKLLTLERRSEAQLLCLMFKRSYNNVKYRLIDPNRVTRAKDKIKFYVPRPTNEKFKSFPFYQGSLLWDQMPPETQKSDSYLAFKVRIRLFLENKGDHPP